MFNLLDLMRAAQGGAAMENMAQQFGLSVDQTRRAMEALMPAFALGFQRNAADPLGFANLLAMMGSGQYAGFFDQPGLAFTQRASSDGSQIVRQLFGNEVGRQVAEQTAAWAGIAPEIMKQMMPAVAAMLMGGLFRTAASEGLADLFEEFARALRGQETGSKRETRARAEPEAMPNPFNAWADMLDTMWGNSPRPATDKPEPKPVAEEQAPNPFAPWAAMMSSMLEGAKPEPPPEPEPAPLQEAPRPENVFEFFDHIAETSREAQQQHLANLQTIFDAYWNRDGKRS